MNHALAESPGSEQARKLKARRRTGGQTFTRNRKDNDIIARQRALMRDQYERNPAAERLAMLRFLAFLKPSALYFVIASLCGVTIYLVPQVIPSAFGYSVDTLVAASKGAVAGHAKANLLYHLFDWYLRHVTPAGTSPLHKTYCLFGSIFGILPIWAVMVYCRIYYSGIGGQRVIFTLRNKLYEHIQSLPLSYFHRHRSGSIVSRLMSDVGLAQNFIGNACTNLWMDSISIILLGSFLFTVDAHLAGIAMLILPLWIASVRFFGQRIRSASHAVQEGLSELSGQVQEKVGGVTVVQAFARERHEMRTFHRIHAALFHRQLDAVRMSAFNGSVSSMLTTIGPIVVMLCGLCEVFAGRLSVGTLLMFWAMLGAFYGPLQRLTDLAAVIANASAAIERIFQVFDVVPEIADSPDAEPLPDRIEGRVTFKNVSFGYDDSPVLRHINLDIAPGEVMAFVGQSGAGKSTLVQLVPRFFDVTEGRIEVDGHDVRDATLKSLRNNIGMVLQDTILFTGTIRENILYGRPGATDEEVIEAAKMGNAHDFIMEQPDGYETEIGERGAKLSGGQKQRLAITRAFLRDPRILILDEATSALDSESENLIQSALSRLMVGRTTLIIAHRLSTIMHADRIVAMKDGCIVEVGKHQDLLKNLSVYYHLYKAQFEHALSFTQTPMEPEIETVRR
ncbi:MAG: ABC transporter ATP-binding protein [Capsulimonadaceae bacterium]|nr:ABC transporter ATP-binding protein [Capsulimonadaceae bacterium]